jgi:N-methylhydantoinase A
MEGATDGNVITVDMGGTSFDVSIVTRGKLLMHREGMIAGHPFGVPSVEVHSIGSGGGSIARVDVGGLLHVGPESAGAQPGPACYRRGGTKPTVTDANLAAGYLNEMFAAGRGMTLDRKLAEQAIGTVASELNLTVEETAGLIAHSCEQQMIGAIEAITIRRGIDPRDYVLVAGGAAIGAHIVSIAQGIGIKKVIIPRMAGVLSAFGILAGEIRFNFARSLFTSTDSFNVSAVKGVVDALRKEGLQFLDNIAVPRERQVLEFSCEARYGGQVWQLTLPFDPSDITTASGVRKLHSDFHRLHEKTYAAYSETDIIEFTEWNVQARGRTDDITLPEVSQTGMHVGPMGSRSIYIKESRKRIDVPAYGPLGLPIDEEVEGPLVIDELLTTIVVEPGVRISLSRLGNYIIHL